MNIYNCSDILILQAKLQYLNEKISAYPKSSKKERSKFKILGKDGLIDSLKCINNTLIKLDMAHQLQLYIGAQIEYFNMVYVENPNPRLYVDDCDLQFLNIKNWAAFIFQSLSDDFCVCKIETINIDNMSVLGLKYFLDEDISSRLPLNVVNDLNGAIGCILVGMPTPGIMSALRAVISFVKCTYGYATESFGAKGFSNIVEELSNRYNKNKNLINHLEYILIKNEEIVEGKDFNQYECEQIFIRIIDLIKGIVEGNIEKGFTIKDRDKKDELYMLEIFGPILATSTAKSVIKFVDEKMSEYINKKFGNKPSGDFELLKKKIEELNSKLEAKEEDEITQEDITDANNIITQIKQKQNFISDVIISDSSFQEWYEKNLDIDGQVPIITRKLELIINNAKDLKISEKHRLEMQEIKSYILSDLKEMTEMRRLSKRSRLDIHEQKAKAAEISLQNNIMEAGIILKSYYGKT